MLMRIVHCGNSKHATIHHNLLGVDGEIMEHLTQLPAIRLDMIQIAIYTYI